MKSKDLYRMWENHAYNTCGCGDSNLTCNRCPQARNLYNAYERALAKEQLAEKFTDQLGELGVNNMISMASEFTVMVDIRTLETLIEMARRAR